MRKLSTGADATLGNYKEMAVIYFGENSGAVKFLDQKIKEQGEHEEVLAEESQMVRLLYTLTHGG